jgi:hypothetical protein
MTLQTAPVISLHSSPWTRIKIEYLEFAVRAILCYNYALACHDRSPRVMYRYEFAAGSEVRESQKGYAWSARGTFSMLSKSIIAILLPLRRTKFAPLTSF